MTSQPTYILSSVPGFISLLQGNHNKDDSTILKLNKTECRTSNNQVYNVIRYDKNLLACDLIPTYGLCRSIILNRLNQVVSFAPPKSIPCDEFIKKYPNGLSENVQAQEFIEGTMINVFWDSQLGLSGGWEIATRNTVGATSSFYKSINAKTFRDMFLEAATANKLNLDKLERDNCYSFVLQHPENRIVVSFKAPQLYLVAVYKIQNGPNNISVSVQNVEEYKRIFQELMNTTVKFPQIYKNFTKYSDLIEWCASMNTSYEVLGIVFYNCSTGERSKVRNPVYEQIRLLRGNQPKLQYQYLCLRKEGKVSEFLKYYPENKKDFSTFRDQVHLFTNTLYTNYISCYIKKEKPLIEFSEQFRTHMFNIHQKYMNELKDKKLFVTNTVVIQYVNNIHPSLLMYCLNYQMRKRLLDDIKS